MKKTFSVVRFQLSTVYEATLAIWDYCRAVFGRFFAVSADEDVVSSRGGVERALCV